MIGCNRAPLGLELPSLALKLTIFLIDRIAFAFVLRVDSADPRIVRFDPAATNDYHLLIFENIL